MVPIIRMPVFATSARPVRLGAFPIGRVVLGLIIASLSAASPERARCNPPDAPRASGLNFVVIMADDLGAKELGCYGHPDHRTPHLDSLADSGMRFETCYATPICTPSRVLIMTGRYGIRTGYYNFLGRPGAPPESSPQHHIGSAERTFADELADHSYATALAGKWQLPGELPGLVHDCGFEEYCIWAYDHNLPPGVRHTGRYENKNRTRTARFWHPSILKNGKYVPTQSDDYGPDLYTDFLIDFITRHRPFVAYYPMALTHTPWEPTPGLGPGRKRTSGGLKANVEYADHCVGRIVAALEELNLRDRTVVIFTGDNGTQGSGKGLPTELGVRVPLIVSCPGIVRSGIVSRAVCDLSDILPTLLEFAGVELPAGRTIDGRSLVPVLRGEAVRHRDWAFSYIHEKRILRDGRWLLEGDGRFFDCGECRDGTAYRDVTDSDDPEVLAARRRFSAILANLPAPEGLEPCPYLTRLWKKEAARTGRAFQFKNSAK